MSSFGNHMHSLFVYDYLSFIFIYESTFIISRLSNQNRWINKCHKHFEKKLAQVQLHIKQRLALAGSQGLGCMTAEGEHI